MCPFLKTAKKSNFTPPYNTVGGQKIARFPVKYNVL